MPSYAAMRSRIFLLIALLAVATAAKEKPGQVLNWPDDARAILRFTVGKIQKVGDFSGHQSFVIDTSVQNLSQRAIPQATFNFYMYDKNRTRIGDGTLEFRNLAPSETIKIKVTATSVGTPASLSFMPTHITAGVCRLRPSKNCERHRLFGAGRRQIES